ncbi:Wzz/FepE/Etk N-terminal domain-containing protein [Sunxiuqinia sp. A32]|uniref:Wzz/FepE/Etk N-terminal domain-containing protein n=1 Tax=Sunxiuqinia sp. A32 TaxID=3461496 RepID=UPI00404642C6
MKNIFDNQNLFVLIWKWKIHFIIVGIVTIIVSAIFSSPYFITPLYKSEARIYPVNTTSYSEESESEQMVEIFNSTDIKREVIEKFNLPERYEIEIDDPYFQTKILKEYNDKVTCKKTEYESIELEALDQDPQVASSIVDSIIVFYNRKVQSIRKQKYEERAQSYSNDLVRKTKEISSIAEKMGELRQKYGLLDYEIQTEQITQGYMTALAEGASDRAVTNIKSIISNLEEKGGEYFLLQREMEALEIQRDTINRRLDKALSQVNKKETYTMVVEEPFPADKKSYPTRWLIVLVSLIATEFLALLSIYIIEGLKNQKS